MTVKDYTVEQFRIAQDNYLNTGLEKYWHELFNISFSFCVKILKKEITIKKLHFDYNEFMDLLLDSLIYVLRRYKKPEGYFIKNPLSCFYMAVKHALYYPKSNKNFIFNGGALLFSQCSKEELNIVSIIANEDNYFLNMGVFNE